MTRIPGNWLAGVTQLRVNKNREEINKLSDDVLEQLVKNTWSFCTNMDEDTKLHRKYAGLDQFRYNIGTWSILTAPPSFFEGIAAFQILRERKGDDYVLNLVGHRKPNTFLEKINYFLTGKYPEIRK